MRGMLGAVARDSVMKIFKALLSRNANTVLAEVKALAELTPDYESVLVDLTSLLHHMALAKTVPEALDEYVTHHEELLALCEQIAIEDIQLFYQICLIGRRDLPLCPDAKSGFEMLMLRLLTFRPAINSNDVHPKSTSGPTNTAVAGSNRAVKSSINSPPVTASVKQESATSVTSKKHANTSSPRAVPAVSVNEQQVEQVKEPAAEYGGVLDWRQIIDQLEIHGMVKQMATNCVIKEKKDNTLLLALDAGYRQLLNPKAKSRLQAALGEYFNDDIHVEIELATVGANQTETPAQAIKREKDSRQQQAVNSIENDGFVQALKNNFDAEIVPGSIQPVTEENN